MGEAKTRAALRSAVERVSVALRKLATAASSHLGSDCWLHAELGRQLLADLGYETKCVAGYAAWRVGENSGDVIAHTNQVQGHLPPGQMGLAHHAWLEYADLIIDFTTYQLRQKARELDALDGGLTVVDWCPEYLMIRRRELHTYEAVAALHTGMAYYEPQMGLESLLSSQFNLDATDLAAARLILANPEIKVIGTRS